MDNTLLQINVTPFETQQLAPPETGGQVEIIQFIYAALFGFPKKGTELLSGERVHFLLLNLRQSAAVRRIGQDDLLLYGHVHRGGDDLVDVTHGLGAETFRLLL